MANTGLTTSEQDERPRQRKRVAPFDTGFKRVRKAPLKRSLGPDLELDTPAAALGRLTIERKGARLTVEGRPDAQMLAQVLAVLLR